ncbi:MAG: Type 1 glutamine amidotransferase-like domain-containing protein [Microvirga sp.]
MRLYLSSFRLGDSTDRLLSLLGTGRRACVISNALDLLSPEARARGTAAFDQIRAFADLGIEASDLDLRDYVENPTGLLGRLSRYDLVWLRGGNAFVLRRAMVASGFDDAVLALLEDDAIVYGGFSAGAVVAAPTLRGIEWMDPPDEVPEGYGKDVVWHGLGLIGFSLVPHFRSNHPEAPLAERAVRFFEQSGLPYRAMADGEVLIVDGPDTRLHPVPGLSSASGISGFASCPCIRAQACYAASAGSGPHLDRKAS